MVKHTIRWLILIGCLCCISSSYAQVQAPLYNIIFGVQNTYSDDIYGEHEISSMDIYQLDSDTFEQRILVQGAGNEYFAMSPNGRYFVFES